MFLTARGADGQIYGPGRIKSQNHPGFRQAYSFDLGNSNYCTRPRTTSALERQREAGAHERNKNGEKSGRDGRTTTMTMTMPVRYGAAAARQRTSTREASGAVLRVEANQLSPS